MREGWREEGREEMMDWDRLRRILEGDGGYESCTTISLGISVSGFLISFFSFYIW